MHDPLVESPRFSGKLRHNRRRAASRCDGSSPRRSPRRPAARSSPRRAARSPGRRPPPEKPPRHLAVVLGPVLAERLVLDLRADRFFSQTMRSMASSICRRTCSGSLAARRAGAAHAKIACCRPLTRCSKSWRHSPAGTTRDPRADNSHTVPLQRSDLLHPRARPGRSLAGFFVRRSRRCQSAVIVSHTKQTTAYRPLPAAFAPASTNCRYCLSRSAQLVPVSWASVLASSRPL